MRAPYVSPQPQHQCILILQASGAVLREACKINQSLTTFGKVIMALVDVAHGKERHVPYRDSVLTHLLKVYTGCFLQSCQLSDHYHILYFAFSRRAKYLRFYIWPNSQPVFLCSCGIVCTHFFQLQGYSSLEFVDMI